MVLVYFVALYAINRSRSTSFSYAENNVSMQNILPVIPKVVCCSSTITLFLECTFCYPFLLSECSIVVMMCLHLETVLFTYPLKRYFSLFIFICCGCLLKILVGKHRLLVHKYCCILVSPYFHDPFYLGYKSRCR